MIGIVVSRFNEEVTSRLLGSALKTLKAGGIPSSSIKVVHVPGGYEIPWAAQELALSGRCQVVIALGAIIKGETPQNEHIARSTIQRLHDVALSTRVPCLLGIVTCGNLRQAMARAHGKMNRGREAASAALEMLRLRRQLRRPRARREKNRHGP